MTDTKTILQIVIDQTIAADLKPLRYFLFSNPSEPLIATGSGGAETGVNPESPGNPGRIDKRKPIWVPFMAALKKQGPLRL